MIPVLKFAWNCAATLVCCFLFSLFAAAQSTDQNFPTAVTSNEIDGIIKARDIGDSRLTSYYYTFDGSQGDVFINVVTDNFSGDIDVFTVEGLRPLTKMVIYSDSGNETGRVVYLRKPERLILRVEGRSPNDDPAAFKIKFAGSFVAMANQKQQDAPKVKGSEIDPGSGVRVNSVGTIVEVLPRPQPSPKTTPAGKEANPVTVAKAKKQEADKKPSAEPAVAEKKENTEVAEIKKPDKKPAPAKTKTPLPKRTAAVAKNESNPTVLTPKKAESPKVHTVFKRSAKSDAANPKAKTADKPAAAVRPAREIKPDPMASIRLIIELKDGKVIERPMSEIAKFGVENGVLTVAAKDGTSAKYSILDVAKLTVQ